MPDRSVGRQEDEVRNSGLRRDRGGPSESPVPSEERIPLGEAKPTLSQTWTVDEPASAMCVQSVDAHMSCSSHSDAQFAAFFIDPRAK